METWVCKNAGKLFAWHWFFWQHDRELPTVVHARCIHISRAPRNTSKVISLPLLTFRTPFLHVLYVYEYVYMCVHTYVLVWCVVVSVNKSY